jgi:hypothetical protein
MLYVVSTNFKNQSGNDSWFWDRDEAQRAYNRRVEEIGDTHGVKLFRLDVDEDLSEIVAEAVSNDVGEVLDTHEPEAEEAVWGELEFRPEGCFYIERTKASTSEYWPYRVESYGTQDSGMWRVMDGTTGSPIAIIKPGTQNEWFRVVVNGYSQTEAFTNLKAAVIHSATEYNGI